MYDQRIIDEWKNLSLGGMSVSKIAIQFGIKEWTIWNEFRKINYHAPGILHKPLLSDQDCAWIAGVFDCEGTLTIHTPWNKERDCRNIQVFIRVEMVEKDLILKLHSLCGGSIIGPVRQNRPKLRPHYIWNLTANGVRWLLPQIESFLILKKKHAKIMMEVLDGNKRGIRRNQMKFPKLFELVSEIRGLNRRGMIPNLNNIRDKDVLCFVKE